PTPTRCGEEAGPACNVMTGPGHPVSADELYGRGFDLALGQEDEVCSGTEGNERVLARDAGDLAVEIRVQKGGDDSLRDPSRPACLVRDQYAAGRLRLPQKIVDGKRRQPPQIDDARA